MTARQAQAQQILARDAVDWLHASVPAAKLCADSRSIAPGDVFVAYPTKSGDGRHYIVQAVERGAAAVLCEQSQGFEWDAALSVAHYLVPQLHTLVGLIASLWYDQPDAGMFTVAVTGTNGKTSCTQWLGQALSREGLSTAVIGTLGIGLFQHGLAGKFEATGYTTPDAIQLQHNLAQLNQRGAQAVAIEASSIGLDQGRMQGMHVDVAVFTNFTRDHLDYHGDMAAYEAAKGRLFDWPGLGHAVINLDDPMGLHLVAQLKQRMPNTSITGYTITGVRLEGVNTLAATDIRLGQSGTVFQLIAPFGAGQVRTQLVGHFNVSNVLAIAGALLSRGVSWQKLVLLLESLVAVPGRMQQLGGIDAPLVVIDYAHTPDALEKTLYSLRQVASERHGNLWCVFGCGGDRDPGKRPQMGAIAAQADHLIVTSDNPRSEEPARIVAQIIAGIDAVKTAQTQVIADRASAILSAVKHAGKQDVVLVAGKGHEDYQEIKGRRIDFLDADHAALALATRATRHGGH